MESLTPVGANTAGYGFLQSLSMWWVLSIPDWPAPEGTKAVQQAVHG